MLLAWGGGGDVMEGASSRVAAACPPPPCHGGCLIPGGCSLAPHLLLKAELSLGLAAAEVTAAQGVTAANVCGTSCRAV